MDKVYNANRPFSLGTAGDPRGADMKFLYDLYESFVYNFENGLTQVSALYSCESSSSMFSEYRVNI